MDLEFSGELWFWKGPAPWHFITVPDEECGALEATSPIVRAGEVNDGKISGRSEPQ